VAGRTQARSNEQNRIRATQIRPNSSNKPSKRLSLLRVMASGVFDRQPWQRSWGAAHIPIVLARRPRNRLTIGMKEIVRATVCQRDAFAGAVAHPRHETTDAFARMSGLAISYPANQLQQTRIAEEKCPVPYRSEGKKALRYRPDSPLLTLDFMRRGAMRQAKCPLPAQARPGIQLLAAGVLGTGNYRER
jgi:hypothetical protein